MCCDGTVKCRLLLLWGSNEAQAERRTGVKHNRSLQRATVQAVAGGCLSGGAPEAVWGGSLSEP